MPYDPKKEKGPTLKEFILFWLIVTGLSLFLAWHKGHFIWQAVGVE